MMGFDLCLQAGTLLTSIEQGEEGRKKPDIMLLSQQ